MFLNQLFDEYYETEDKQEIIKKFIDSLWKSKYRFSKYSKYYSYKVKDELLHNRDELINLFKQFENIEYKVCKSFSKKRLDSIDYIRIHINNMYGFLIDKDVYYSKEYYKLLLSPKQEYLKTVRLLKDGLEVDVDQIKNVIENKLVEAEKLKHSSIKKKINMTWSQYKKLIDSYISRIFDNYIPVHEYEKKHGWEMKVDVSYWSEENYIIKYFCKSLTGYLRNYVRDSKPKDAKIKKCIICQSEFECLSDKKLYCMKCKKNKQLEWQRNSMNKLRKM